MNQGMTQVTDPAVQPSGDSAFQHTSASAFDGSEHDFRLAHSQYTRAVACLVDVASSR